MGARKDLALKSIRRKFEVWRSNRRNGEEVPAALWDDFHALEGRFGRTNLAKALGLNSSDVAFQMNLRGARVEIESRPLEAVAAPKAFTASQTVAITKVVSVPMPPPQARTGGAAAVEVQAPSGWILRLQAEASPEFLRVFVEAAGRAGGVP